MNIKPLHRFDIPPQEAISIQKELSRQVVVTSTSLSHLKKIAGADVHFPPKESKCQGIVVTFSYPQMEVLEKKSAIQPINYPYVPGLLSFRELPVLLEILKSIEDVDLMVVDGQGIAHPRRIGLASHLGLFLDKPTIGCAKSVLVGKYEPPDQQKGSWSYLKDKEEIVGAALRTKERTKPVFVSPGHKISLEQSIEIILNTTANYRQPDVTRIPHMLLK